jgi:hypothetical protein
MIKIENFEVWKRVVAQAKKKAAAQPGRRTPEQWEKAIDRAAGEIEKYGFRMFYNEVGDCLYLVSSTSGNFYTVNGDCRLSQEECCPSYLGKHVCWHRIAKQLWKNYLNEVRKPMDDSDEIINAEFVTDDKTPILCERCQSQIKTGNNELRKVFRTDSQGREYYVEKVGSITVSDRIYTGRQEVAR